MLYHVSFKKLRSTTLYPRIPRKRADNEDKTIKRICFAPSIEQALSAMPNGGLAMKNLLFISQPLNAAPILHIYSVNECNIESCNIMSGEQIIKYVPDAYHTGETWVINQKIKCFHEIIEVTSADIKSGHDMNGKSVAEVNYIEWKHCKATPQTSLEIRFKGSQLDIRKALALFDWEEFLKNRKEESH